MAVAFCFIATAALLSGCSKDYEHSQLGLDCAEAGQVREMVAALMAAGDQNLARTIADQSASDLTESQSRMLTAVLTQIASAQSVELTKIDRFGEDILRASLHLRGETGQRDIHMLLIARDGHLRWAGPN